MWIFDIKEFIELYFFYEFSNTTGTTESISRRRRRSQEEI